MKPARPIRWAIDAALAAERLESPWKTLELHESLKLLRQARVMDQVEVSRRTGIPQYTISRIETGSIDPSWSTIRKYYGGLECFPVLLPLPDNSQWAHRDPQWRPYDIPRYEELDP